MKKRYRVLEDINELKTDDIIVEDEKLSYMYCTGKVCTTIFFIEKNPDKFELMDTYE